MPAARPGNSPPATRLATLAPNRPRLGRFHHDRRRLHDTWRRLFEQFRIDDQGDHEHELVVDLAAAGSRLVQVALPEHRAVIVGGADRCHPPRGARRELAVDYDALPDRMGGLAEARGHRLGELAIANAPGRTGPAQRHVVNDDRWRRREHIVRYHVLRIVPLPIAARRLSEATGD